MIRRALLASTVLATAVAGAAVLAPSAQARSVPDGRVWSAVQTDSAHRITLSGWAYDPTSSRTSVVVKFYDGRTYIGKTMATNASPTINRKYHVGGRHGFKATFTYHRSLRYVTARTPGVHPGHRVTIDVQAVRHVTSSTRDRIIAVARYYVGRARYTYGGATPRTGFDCSGYTQWVYAHSPGAPRLPRTAEAQRRASHRITAAQARPGDLVFYLGGGGTYHVAVYAGHHMQYAAATPRDGIRYQAVWSSAVQYGSFVR